MNIEGWQEMDGANKRKKTSAERKQTELDPDQEQQLPDAETQPAKAQPETMPRVISRVCAFSEIWRQDQLINQMEENGYLHYETHNIGGNECLLRFRKRDK
ncbi:MAG: hypothetical protein GX556_15965 [Fibrobacter sp.]|nr:hypothetical protein [Fibrobacter sp.]